MSNVNCKIIADSIGSHGIRLTTIQVHVPKFLLAEINTHRTFSRSFSSSRAIPAHRLRESATYTPSELLSNQPGMAGGEVLGRWRSILGNAIWGSARRSATWHHKLLEWCGLHKQHTNRIIEPYVWVDGVISSTEWANFLALRNHPAAQPEFHQLAAQIEQLLIANKPTPIQAGGWHLPYITDTDRAEVTADILPKLSAARCARVSYGFRDVRDLSADLKRADMLLNSNPQHLSPFEHPASCFGSAQTRSGNYQGWHQLRKILGDKTEISKI